MISSYLLKQKYINCNVVQNIEQNFKISVVEVSLPRRSHKIWNHQHFSTQKTQSVLKPRNSPSSPPSSLNSAATTSRPRLSVHCGIHWDLMALEQTLNIVNLLYAFLCGLLFPHCCSFHDRLCLNRRSCRFWLCYAETPCCRSCA